MGGGLCLLVLHLARCDHRSSPLSRHPRSRHRLPRLGGDRRLHRLHILSVHPCSRCKARWASPPPKKLRRVNPGRYERIRHDAGAYELSAFSLLCKYWLVGNPDCDPSATPITNALQSGQDGREGRTHPLQHRRCHDCSRHHLSQNRHIIRLSIVEMISSEGVG